MPELIVMCGPAGSGKSTWAQEYVQSHPDYYIVSTDDIRKTLFGDPSNQSNPQKVFTFAHMKIYYYLSHGRNVIFDAMNLRAKDRRELIKKFKPIGGIVFSCVACLTPCKICKARQEQRERKVPLNVIDQQFSNFKLPELSEGWDTIQHYKKW